MIVRRDNFVNKPTFSQGLPKFYATESPEGALTARSFILCDALRSVAKERLVSQPWGAVSAQTMRKVEDVLRILLDL
jgi:mRNA interferase MazF